jgi:hypothetical protein
VKIWSLIQIRVRVKSWILIQINLNI